MVLDTQLQFGKLLTSVKWLDPYSVLQFKFELILNVAEHLIGQVGTGMREDDATVYFWSV